MSNSGIFFVFSDFDEMATIWIFQVVNNFVSTKIRFEVVVWKVFFFARRPKWHNVPSGIFACLMTFPVLPKKRQQKSFFGTNETSFDISFLCQRKTKSFAFFCFIVDFSFFFFVTPKSHFGFDVTVILKFFEEVGWVDRAKWNLSSKFDETKQKTFRDKRKTFKMQKKREIKNAFFSEHVDLFVFLVFFVAVFFALNFSCFQSI